MTRLIPLHINKGKTIARTIFDRTEYAKNERKTEGEYIRTYECEARSADEEFMLSKSRYEFITGRDNGGKNVLAYHIRQAFKPGEITPEEANEIGRQLVLSFTKGKHAFVVATHIECTHIHNHIIYNSTTLDCPHKFKNFWGSSKAVRRISDLLCAEHGLSVIENPAPSKGFGDKWRGEDKKPTHKEDLRRLIDKVAPLAATFEDFLAKLRERGCVVSTKRKQPSLIASGWKKPFRLDSHGDEYTESAIRARLGRVKIITSSSGNGMRNTPSLLIDIQAKIREGKRAGYEQWTKIFNLKQTAKTLIFLQEQGIDSYEDLKKKSSSASGEFAVLNKKIRDTEIRMNEITELQKQIGVYGKTRATYEAYKKSGWSRKYYDEHSGDIILHRIAKKFFDAQGLGDKLPSIASLKQEWAALAAEKRKLYSGYHELKETSRPLTVAKGNADRILGITPQIQTQENTHGDSR